MILLYFTLFSISNALIIGNIQQFKIELVEKSAQLLPKIDTIGHNLLLNNEVVIKNVLDMENVPLEIKKQIILDIIRVTQYGDQFGGFILSHYHDLVDFLL
tara:strand:+ start:478 stop:780 length:303 start_codon:yes stop_codon:yes gene_type:complete